jgi:hypothetical protein
VDWIAHKLDTFLAAVVIAFAAIAVWQGQAFMTEYQRRLGGQLSEARSQVTAIQTGLRYKLMSDTVRGEIEHNAAARAQALQASYDTVAKTNLITRPIALARHGDPALLEGTWRSFAPTLPVSGDAIAYIVIGTLIGFIVYEAIKLPLLLILQPKRRRFRKRG